jgi:hypothetical protein
MIFWWRRWIEHSRSPNVTTLPCESAKICTSTWRAPATYRSQKTVPSPNAEAASRRAAAIAASSSFLLSTIRMPRPPPPADALTSTGNAVTSAGSVHDGSVCTPASASSAFASSLLPMAAIAFGGGPTQTSPASITACAKAGFSERKP